MTTAERTLANPFYAVVGAGDLAVKQVTDAVAQLRERTETAGENAQARIEETRARLTNLPDEVPATIDELRGKLNPDEIRKIADSYLESAADFYNSLAERGEETIERFRQQPLVQENLTRAEKAYNEAVDLTEDTLGVVSTQTRAAGEQAAKLAGRTSKRVNEAGEAIDGAVADAVSDVTGALNEAGATAKARSNAAAKKIDGAAGTVEGKARTSKSSPAKKISSAKKAPAKKAPAKKAPARKSSN
ncbi:heparin-binding hemagglutinin [Gordonia sinesedis]